MMEILEQLTNRQKEILTELALGHTEKETASRLFVSTETIHTHTYNMRKKTKCRSNLELVVKFILSHKHPKKSFAAILFLILQFGMIGYTQRQEVRRVPKTFRYSKYSRLTTKDNLYL